MAGASGLASDDYGFRPLEEDCSANDEGFRRGASDGYESSNSAGSSISARSARSMGSVMRTRRKQKKKKKKKKHRHNNASVRGDSGSKKKIRGFRRRKHSGSTGMNTSLVQGLSDRDEPDDGMEPDNDSSSGVGSAWSCLSFLNDPSNGSSLPEENGSFPYSPTNQTSGGGGKNSRRSKRSTRRFLFPASPSSLWNCAIPPCSDRSGDDRGDSDARRHPRRAGGQHGPNCCSSPRIGPDGHALTAAIPPVPPFMLTRTHSRLSLASGASSSGGGGGLGAGGGLRSERGSDEGSSTGGGSWADALAGAAVFGTGMAARAAGAAANGGCAPYSHRSAITDGGEPQPSGPTAMERRVLRPNGSHLATGHWSDGNRRDYMEDRYAIEPMGTVTIDVPPVELHLFSSTTKELPALEHSPSPRGIDELALVPSEKPFAFEFDPVFPQELVQGAERVVVPATLYGVYDGHGGPNASQYCSDWMATYLRRQHSWPVDLGSSLCGAFDEADEDFVASGHLDGTTACVALVLGSERVVCANAGDSRSVVVRRDGSIARLSRDHKPGTPDETRRITEMGGRVMYMGGRWRVEGSLAVSRGIGDAALKPYISSEPELVEYDLDEDDLFLVVATDGIWDVMENEYLANIVLRKATTAAGENDGRKADPVRLRAIGRQLCDEARRQGSSDNLCAIVVDLKSSVHPLSRPSRW